MLAQVHVVRLAISLLLTTGQAAGDSQSARFLRKAPVALRSNMNLRM
jgi:hypothetical protein